MLTDGMVEVTSGDLDIAPREFVKAGLARGREFDSRWGLHSVRSWGVGFGRTPSHLNLIPDLVPLE